LPSQHLHPRFLEAVESMFNNNIDIEGLIKKWFDNKEVDQMIE
jgi:hypothetical protein